LFVFSIFRKNKQNIFDANACVILQMLIYSKRLLMRREIQNPQIFQPNPESFSRAIIFSLYSFCHKILK
jgi:hypothetical protein